MYSLELFSELCCEQKISKGNAFQKKVRKADPEGIYKMLTGTTTEKHVAHFVNSNMKCFHKVIWYVSMECFFFQKTGFFLI